MSKKIISDIISSKKSIRQIPITKEMKKKIETENEIDEEKRRDFHLPVKRQSPSWQRKPMNPKFAIWTVAGICILALVFGLSMIFSSATVIITPRTAKITFISDTYTAKSTTSGISDLQYELLNIKQSLGETVNATEEKEVTQKASGKIIIYNNYSTAPQRLINNTRFEANNGKVYRISSSVVVPGTTKTGGQIIPGRIEATVFADQAGDAYNMKLSDLTGDFKIPGFKGDPRYNSFYARLKNDISGGLIGKQRIIASDLRTATEVIIKEKLKEQLIKELYAIKPDNFIIFSNAYSIDYSNLPDTAVDTDKAEINIEATINAIVFNNQKLAKYLAGRKLTDFDGLPVEFIPSDNLVVTFLAKDSTGLWKNNTLDIKITGDGIIKWVYSADDFKRDLLGKKEADMNGVLQKYKDSITGIQVIFKPVWTRYFPDSINKIKLQELD
jgi:hypothetical protein